MRYFLAETGEGNLDLNIFLRQKLYRISQKICTYYIHRLSYTGSSLATVEQ